MKLTRRHTALTMAMLILTLTSTQFCRDVFGRSRRALRVGSPRPGLLTCGQMGTWCRDFGD